MGRIAFLNGKFLPWEEALIHAEDRANNFGDGIYEVVVAYHGKPFYADRHIDRLFYSASQIELEIPYSREEIKDIITTAIEKSGLENAMVYFQVSRGFSEREHAFPENAEPTFYLTVKPFQPMPMEERRRGVKTITYPDIRWSRCDIKSLNLLPNVMAREYAKRKGALEAIFVKDGVKFTEGSSSNFFAFINGKLWTHPLTNEILAGITRSIVLEIAKELGIGIVEKPILTTMMDKIEEAFITSTTKEIIPVSALDEKRLNVGEKTIALMEEYVKLREK